MSGERGACIREERATREALGLCGDGKALSPGRGIAWCGRRLVGWTFEDADHALLTIKYGTGIEPCDDCLRALRKVLGPDPTSCLPVSCLDEMITSLEKKPQALPEVELSADLVASISSDEDD